MGCRRWLNRLSQRLIKRHWPIAASACSCETCFGRFSTSILRRPTPMAPEEQMTTLCPSLRNLTAVSTITVRVESSGSCVFSSTMELVPEYAGLAHGHSWSTRFGLDSPSLITMPRERLCFIAKSDSCISVYTVTERVIHYQKHTGMFGGGRLNCLTLMTLHGLYFCLRRTLLVDTQSLTRTGNMHGSDENCSR
jgi:hypothetical protein